MFLWYFVYRFLIKVATICNSSFLCCSSDALLHRSSPVTVGGKLAYHRCRIRSIQMFVKGLYECSYRFYTCVRIGLYDCSYRLCMGGCLGQKSLGKCASHRVCINVRIRFIRMFVLGLYECSYWIYTDVRIGCLRMYLVGFYGVAS